MKTTDLAVALGGALVGLAAFVYYAANAIDHGAQREFKSNLAKFADKRHTLAFARSVFLLFRFASDRYFGAKLLSARAFLGSSLLSLTWITMVMVACCIFIPAYRNWFSQPFYQIPTFRFLPTIVLGAIVIDYVCVCVTRAVFRSSARKGSLHPAPAFGLGLAITAATFYLLFSGYKFCLVPGTHISGPIETIAMWLDPTSIPMTYMAMEPLTSDMLKETSPGNFEIEGGWLTEVVYMFPESVLFLSSLLTCLWLALYLAGYMTLYLAVRIDRIGGWARRSFDFHHSPAHSFASVAIIGACAIFLLVLIANIAKNALMSLLS